MKHRIDGSLRHRFWGDYSAAIVLGPFPSPELQEALLRQLGERWSADDDCLIGILDSAELAAFEEAFTFEIKPCGRRGCKKKCANAAISSTPHSIDCGPPFFLVYDDGKTAVDPRQLNLF